MTLVAGTNHEGYLHALARVFDDSSRPVKSAISQFRKAIHFRFFGVAYKNLIKELDKRAPTFMGLRVYAIDGQQLTLPRSKNIVEAGFNGRAVSKYRESWYPKGFLTHAFDVLGGTSKNLTFNPTLHEQADARNLLKTLETKSLTIYDRLYFSEKMVAAHIEHGSFFLMRCRSNCHSTVQKLLSGNKKIMTGESGGKRIQFVKIWNCREKCHDVFAMNLPKRFVTRRLILQLYRLRWEVETSFKELTAIANGEQWHSKTYNGIMQELYALMWLINATKGIMQICGKKPLDPTKRTYSKPNFKLIFNLLANRLPEIWYNFQTLIAWISSLVKDSTEKRKRCSRRYPRQLRKPASPYPYNNTEWYWEKEFPKN